MTAFQPPTTGGLMTSSVTGQALGGAFAVIWLAYNPIATAANGVSAQSLEDALTIVFTVGSSVAAMVLHVVGSFIVQKYLTPQT